MTPVTALTVTMIGLGALGLAMIGQALGPDSGRFPCANPWMRYGLRFYALTLVFRAATLGVWGAHHPALDVSLPVVLGSFGMFQAHTILVILTMRSRLPHGVWPRIERRLHFIKLVAQSPTSSPAAAAMAADGASVTDILRAEGVKMPQHGDAL